MDFIWHMVCCPRMQKSQAKENTTATTLKQQISKFYPIIISTEVSFYIYDRPLTGINVVAYVFKAVAFTKKDKLKPVLFI